MSFSKEWHSHGKIAVKVKVCWGFVLISGPVTFSTSDCHAGHGWLVHEGRSRSDKIIKDPGCSSGPQGICQAPSVVEKNLCQQGIFPYPEVISICALAMPWFRSALKLFRVQSLSYLCPDSDQPRGCSRFILWVSHALTQISPEVVTGFHLWVSHALTQISPEVVPGSFCELAMPWLRSAQRLLQGSICELAMPWLRSAHRLFQSSFCE